MGQRGRGVGLGLLAGVIGLGAVLALLQGLVVSAQMQTEYPLKKTDGSARVTQEITLPFHLGYGLNVRDPAHIDTLVAPLGFEWVKLYEQYDALPAERLSYKVLYRIQLNGPPDDLAAWGDHVDAIARAGKGLVEAYEIGNEVNQSWQWGHQVPDPDEYVATLKVAYARIKATDPDVSVVSAGLGPVGRIKATPEGEGWPGNNGASMDEWEYARVMFSRCISGCFDVFGYHPFGFFYPPETAPDDVDNNFAFRGAEDLRQIMLEFGLDDVPMWVTEFGWIRDPDPDGFGWCKLVPEFNDPFGWMLVSEMDQADYLSRAFAYADAHWPWMETMFVWNLDWYDQGWTCDHIRFFSLRHVDGTTTPAYEALAAMNKRPGPVGCRLETEPADFYWSTCPGGWCQGGALRTPTLLTGVVSITALAGCDQISWTVTLAPSSTLQPTLLVTQGRIGQPLTLTLDAGAFVTQDTGTLLFYPTGTYTSLLTLTTIPSDVLGNPQSIWIELVVTPEMYAVYLPMIVRDFSLSP